jgi:hypothetical protein
VNDDAYKNQRALIIENESSDTARIKQLLIVSKKKKNNS